MYVHVDHGSISILCVTPHGLQRLLAQCKNMDMKQIIRYCMNMGDSNIQLPTAIYIKILLQKYYQETTPEQYIVASVSQCGMRMTIKAYKDLWNQKPQSRVSSWKMQSYKTLLLYYFHNLYIKFMCVKKTNQASPPTI